MSSPVTDRAGRDYWDDLWGTSPPPAPIDARNPAPGNASNRRFDALFREYFAGLPTRSRRLLEVGCARSAWLPYFGREFGFGLHGLDYSELGCEQERTILAQAGLEGDVTCADLFAPPAALLGAFDVVVSFGVVEHFSDTFAVTRALAALLRPGGLAITVVPNMRGVIGRIEQLIDPEVYGIHVPISPGRLAEAHAEAGLEVLRSEHFLSTGFGILNLNGLDPAARSTRAKAVMRRQLSRLSKAVWALEDRIGPLPASRALSPYVICVARRGRALV